VVAVGAGKANAAPTPTRATIEATQFTVPERQTGEEFAVCKGNKRAVGGGVVQSGEAAVGMTVIASGPLDASGVTLQTKDGDIAKQWYATVNNFTNEQRTYRVFAICSGGSDATIKATPLFTVLSGDTVERFAVCPAKKRALGGGIVQSGEVAGTAFYERANGPLDSSGVTLQTNDGDTAKQWYAAQRNSSGTDQRFKLMAICGT
jgi:hypothetical protein